MKQAIYPVVAAAVMTAATVFAAPRPLPWSQGIGKAANFKANSSGKMTISDDAKANAVRFDVEFKPGTDFWAYPALNLRGESLADVSEIRFEFKAEQQPADAGYRCVYVMIGDEKPYFTLSAPKAEYQSVTIDVAKAVKNPAAVKSLKIGMNPKGAKLTFFIRNLEFLGEKKNAAYDAADAVVAAAPGTVFLQGEPLEFKLKPYAAVPAKWTLRNWKDETLRSGDWPERGPLTLAALPNGYYKLELAAEGAKFTGFRSFTVVADPAKRPANPDMFFALDSAQSWLARPDSNNPRQPANAYEVVSEVARRAGLAQVRGRLSWAETEPAPGKYDWKQYKTNADLLSARGVTISGMYHNAPKWAKTNTEHLPGDLPAAYTFAKKAAEVFKGQMTDWEFWNEQDIGFTSEGAWDYAAALKAAALGFKAGDPSLAVAIGGYAITPVSSYADVVMENGAGEYFDLFNVHSYHAIKDFPAILKNIRAHMERHGIADRPVWFTENGCRMEGSGRQESYMPGIRMHSPDQELLIAEFMPKMMIAMQFLGVARDFFFVLPPYNEGGGSKDWGLMRRDFTVKPGFTAFATLTDRLGNAVPAGEVDLGKGIKGYLYRQKNGSNTLVYWSISPLDNEGERPNLTTADRLERTFSLPKQKGVLKGVDLFGTPFETDGTKVTATRFPSFLDGVTGVKVSVPFKMPKTAGAPENPEFDKTIIFRTELSKDFVLSAAKDSVDARKDDAKFKLQIWNLSEKPKTGIVSISGGKTSGLPESVSIPAFGKTELELGFTPELDREFKGELRATGVFGGRKATPLVIPMQSLKAMADSGRKVEMPQMVDPVNWRKNASGTMTIGYDAAEKAISFRTQFPPNVDRWTYPEYVLQLPQESLKGALGIGFEVKVSKASAVKQMLVMAVAGKQKEGGSSVNLQVTPPAEQWEKRFVQFPAGFDPAKVEQLRIGINPLEDDVTVQLRDIRIIYAP